MQCQTSAGNAKGPGPSNAGTARAGEPSGAVPAGGVTETNGCGVQNAGERGGLPTGDGGWPAWLVRVCQRYYTVDLLRDWIARARQGMKVKPGQVSRWERSLAILEGTKHD